MLASGSPRRKELLAEMGINEFKVIPSGIDEDALTDPDPWITAKRLAREKALDVYAKHSDSIVIGGDTVVALENEDGSWEQLAKPADETEAKLMLSKLSGRTHFVITGVCVKWPGGFSSFSDESKVTFRKLSAEEIDRYVASGESLDKAGGYGLQGGAKGFIAKLEGSVNNVIGLPTERCVEIFMEI